MTHERISGDITSGFRTRNFAGVAQHLRALDRWVRGGDKGQSYVQSVDGEKGIIGLAGPNTYHLYAGMLYSFYGDFTLQPFDDTKDMHNADQKRMFLTKAQARVQQVKRQFYKRKYRYHGFFAQHAHVPALVE